MIDHLDIVLKELPDILLLLNDLIPGRIKDLQEEYNKMIEEEYPIAYLNFEENLKIIEKRENDILDRARVLNITDSLFDLRTILEYLDGLFKDLEKEKSARREFDINNEAFSNKVKKLEKLFKLIINKGFDTFFREFMRFAPLSPPPFAQNRLTFRKMCDRIR